MSAEMIATGLAVGVVFGFLLGFAFSEWRQARREAMNGEGSERGLDVLSAKVETRIEGLTAQIGQLWQSIETHASRDMGLGVEVKTQLQQLVALSKDVSQTTQALEGALRGDTRQQGDWGELVLERVLEASGLVQGREYLTQVSLVGPDGERLRPDVVVRLPNNRCLIIDSKVSIQSLVQAPEGATSEVSKATSQSIAQSLRRHIQDLVSRNYGKAKADGLLSPDIVFLFVPVESILHKAMTEDPSLLATALKQNIAIVSPLTLMSALKIAGQLWNQERQNQNTAEIIELATRICNRVVEFANHFDRAASKVDEAQELLEKMRLQMSDRGVGVVAPLKKLRELGIKSKRELPSRIETELD